MAKRYKVKRYGKIYKKSRNSRVTVPSVIIGIFVVAALIFIGAAIYQPIYDFISGGMLPSHSSSESQPETTLPPETSTAPPETQPPEPVRQHFQARYVSQEILADSSRLNQFLASAKAADVNAIVIELKNSQGMVMYQSALETVASAGAVSPQAIDMEAAIQAIKDAGMAPVARIYAFEDHTASNALREMTVKYMDSDWMWLDDAQENGGQPWLNPYSAQARGYIQSIAVEAASLGFEEILFAGLHFPTAFSLEQATFGYENTGTTKQQVLSTFLDEVSAALKNSGAEISVSVTAPHLFQRSEQLYGENPLAAFSDYLVYVDISPSQFGASFASAALNLDQGASKPYETVSSAGKAILSMGRGADEVGVILQGYTASESERAYGKEDIEAQIRAAEELGIENYLVYSPNGAYPDFS